MIRIEFEITDKQIKEVANTINIYYGTTITPEMVCKYITDLNLLCEIHEESWRDTCIREQILETITKGVVGMKFPLYGDAEVYKEKFTKRAKEKGFM